MASYSDITTNPCPVCGEDRPELFKIFYDGHLKLYKCRRCGFVAQYPGPGKVSLIVNYENFDNLEFLKDGREFMHPEKSDAFIDIIKRISFYCSQGKLLDIGCGDGHFLSLCTKYGYECYGVEWNKSLSSYATLKSGAVITQGAYSKNMYRENSFDIITLIQVLEHCLMPNSILEAAMYHLRPGGLLIIEVPSINSPHFLAYKFTRIKYFVNSPVGVVFYHLSYFNPKTLATLIDKIGFVKIDLITGRWACKYQGIQNKMGKAIDSLLNLLKIGGILYIGAK